MFGRRRECWTNGQLSLDWADVGFVPLEDDCDELASHSDNDGLMLPSNHNVVGSITLWAQTLMGQSAV